MNEVIEPFAFDTTIDGLGAASMPAMSCEVPQLAARVVQRRPRARRWSSELCEQDLQCLLQIIETDLIPQLLSSYSPARYAPSELITG